MNWNDYFTLDHATGLLTWKARPLSHFRAGQECRRWNTRYAGRIVGAGSTRHVHLSVRVYREQFKVHRIVWEMANNTVIPAGMLVDHANGNQIDNRPENLRLATIAENGRNCKSRGGNKWGMKGVRQQGSGGRFAAQIRAGGNPISLGTYDTPQEAHEAYRVAAIRYHGEFANYGIDPHNPR